MSKYYAGIGSRRTPPDVLKLMGAVAWHLDGAGWTLRSGGADGADRAFSTAVHPDQTQLFLPWPGFGGVADHDARLTAPAEWTFAIAERFHPNWSACSQAAQKLHARNVHQVLGPEPGSAPSRFVLCWTPDGSLDGRSMGCGGTGQALRIAAASQIPVFNLLRREHRARMESMVGVAPAACPF